MFSAVRGACKVGRIRRVALRTGPSSLAPRCIRALTGLPFGHVDVKLRAFSRTALHLLGHQRATMRTVATVRHYQRTKFQGVDVSLVCKLPKRATRH